MKIKELLARETDDGFIPTSDVIEFLRENFVIQKGKNRHKHADPFHAMLEGNKIDVFFAGQWCPSNPIFDALLGDNYRVHKDSNT